MQLDLTTQLQPAVWGLVVALLASFSAILVQIDRDELDAFRQYLRMQHEWRRRLEMLRERLERVRSWIVALVSRSLNERVSRS
jgi:hypothetical protein